MKLIWCKELKFENSVINRYSELYNTQEEAKAVFKQLLIDFVWKKLIKLV